MPLWARAREDLPWWTVEDGRGARGPSRWQEMGRAEVSALAWARVRPEGVPYRVVEWEPPEPPPAVAPAQGDLWDSVEEEADGSMGPFRLADGTPVAGWPSGWDETP